jgi:hypothetical protein
MYTDSIDMLKSPEAEDINNLIKSPKEDFLRPKLSLVPYGIMEHIAKVRQHRAMKYAGQDYWKSVKPEQWVDDILMHIEAYIWREKIDAESGLSHLAHAACAMAFLIESEGNSLAEEDDE